MSHTAGATGWHIFIVKVSSILSGSNLVAHMYHFAFGDEQQVMHVDTSQQCAQDQSILYWPAKASKAILRHNSQSTSITWRPIYNMPCPSRSNFWTKCTSFATRT